MVADTEIELYSAVIQSTGYLYRLMTLVKTSDSLRCLNPNDLFKSQIHVHRPSCDHTTSPSRTVHPWAIGSILQQWEPGKMKSDSCAHVAKVGDSIIQRNIALALAGENCVLQTDRCCFGCAVDLAISRRTVLIPLIKRRRQLLTHSG
jgi:hypothetical protein